MATSTDGQAVAGLDRQGLVDTVDQYLAALVAGDPSAAPLEGDIRTVENVRRIRPGEGLWSTASAAPQRFAIYVPDPRRQSVGFIGMIERDGEPALVALRLLLDAGRVTEAEHIVAADIPEEKLANLQEPRSGLLTEIPAAQRIPHDELVAIAATYYDALVADDGSLTPLAEDSERRENGLIAAGRNSVAPPPGANGRPHPPIAHDCKGQLDSKVMTYIQRIDNRRVFAADPVTGLVMGLSHFRHPMDTGPYEVVTEDGKTVMWEMSYEPFDLPAAHIFKVGPEGELHEIEAMGFIAPYDSPTGWE